MRWLKQKRGSDLLLVREGHAIDALQGVSGRITLPVARGVLPDGEGADLASVRDVGSLAEVDERTTLVNSGRGALRRRVRREEGDKERKRGVIGMVPRRPSP